MKIICVGRNYVKHIEELKNVVLKEPAIFMKPATSLLSENEKFTIPSFSNNIHHEIEIVLQICKKGKDIELEKASSYFDKIALGIDFTARDVQDKLKDKKLSWELSKAFDGAAALGTLKDKDQFNLADLNFHLLRNGTQVQKGNSQEMIFKFDYIISFVSTYFTLEPGDLIYTGTPSGVGQIQKDDVLEGFIEDQKVLEIGVK